MAEDPEKPVTGYPLNYASSYYSFKTTSYPSVPAHPQNPIINPHTLLPHIHNPSPNPKSKCRRRTISILLFCGVLAACCYYLVMVYGKVVPHFRIDLVSFSPFNSTTSTQGTAIWEINFTLQNPFRYSYEWVNYHDIHVLIFYGEKFITKTVLPFYHLSSTEYYRTLQARFSVAYDGVVKDIVEFRNGGEINFDVRMKVQVTAKQIEKIRGTEFSKVKCRNVKVKIMPNSGEGELLDGPRNCTTTFVRIRE